MSRSLARTAAMQLIYARLCGGDEEDASLNLICQQFREEHGDQIAVNREYIDDLLQGVLDHLEKIDEVISRYSRNWTIQRMPRVDLTILRLAVWEILGRHDEETPPPVVIDEAVEMAKTYSDEGSGRFINGVLGAVVRTEEKWDAD